MIQSAFAEPLSGQVSEDAVSYPGAVTKSMTMAPGAGTFSADHLRFGRQVAITLYNPNTYPMRFDTVQRIGKEYSWIVPANSSRTVAFRYFNPVSDEVRFLSYQDPGSLVISEGKVTQPQMTAAEPAPEPTPTAVSPPATEPEPTAQGPMQTESQSAVRGYW
ncbi:hypothetical protein [Vampirovibrio sp.]|uniref:hypothetical protein n=1 Tax=Vampirovibrio sp. TaxID=2717857 RepID=UPI003593E40B